MRKVFTCLFIASLTLSCSCSSDNYHDKSLEEIKIVEEQFNIMASE